VDHLTRIAVGSGVTLLDACRVAGDDGDLRATQRNAVADFYHMITRLQQDAADLGIGELLKRVLERSGYIDSLKASSKAEDADRLDNLEELVTDAVKYENRTEDATLAGFLERLALLADIDEADDLESKVSLMTLHSAKGLEFPIIFMVGMEERIFPHERSMGDEFELAEERRLCYVGITRAERMLYMSYARGRTIFGQPRRMKPSRFLKDLPEEHVERKVPYDSPLSPRMFGDEEAAQQKAEHADLDFDITEVLDRARANQKEAEQRETDSKSQAPKQEPAKPAPKPKSNPRNRSKRPTGATRRSKKRRKSGAVPGGLHEGAKIEHEDLGEGIIVTIDDGATPTLTVAFAEKGLKKLLADHPKLTLQD
jgi:ATP-dependent exoDNAse (exonuclease V) beta subunit